MFLSQSMPKVRTAKATGAVGGNGSKVNKGHWRAAQSFWIKQALPEKDLRKCLTRQKNCMSWVAGLLECSGQVIFSW